MTLLRLALPRWFPVPARQYVPDARSALLGVAQRIVQKKRTALGANDLLSRLITASDEGERMSEAELYDQVLTLLLAGHETTALNLTYTFWLLSQNPEALARVEAEVDALPPSSMLNADHLLQLQYTHAALKEGLRLYPPAWMVGRTPLENCTLGGYQFLKGDQIIIPLFNIQRDPRLHQDAELFQPERFLPGGAIYEKRVPRFAYAPFGAGPRGCVGNHFAALEALAILAAVLRNFRLEALSKKAPKAVSSVTLRPRGRVEMRAMRRDAR